MDENMKCSGSRIHFNLLGTPVISIQFSYFHRIALFPLGTRPAVGKHQLRLRAPLAKGIAP